MYNIREILKKKRVLYDTNDLYREMIDEKNITKLLQKLLIWIRK